MAGLPHQRVATQLGDLVEQRLAGLHVGDDRGAGVVLQHVGGVDRHELVAPHHAAQMVDGADAVAVAVEADADVAAVLRHRLLQVDEVLLDRRVRMVVGEVAVDLVEQQDVPAGQLRGQAAQDLAGGAVAGVPGDGQVAGAVIVPHHAVHIGVLDVDVLRRAFAGHIIGLRRDDAQVEDLLAVDRTLAQHHLDAVVVRRVVRAGDHDAGRRLAVAGGEIQHRRGAEPDPQHMQAAGDQTLHHGGFQLR